VKKEEYVVDETRRPLLTAGERVYMEWWQIRLLEEIAKQNTQYHGSVPYENERFKEVLKEPQRGDLVYIPTWRKGNEGHQLGWFVSKDDKGNFEIERLSDVGRTSWTNAKTHRVVIREGLEEFRALTKTDAWVWGLRDPE